MLQLLACGVVHQLSVPGDPVWSMVAGTAMAAVEDERDPYLLQWHQPRAAAHV